MRGQENDPRTNEQPASPYRTSSRGVPLPPSPPLLLLNKISWESSSRVNCKGFSSAPPATGLRTVLAGVGAGDDGLCREGRQ